MFTVAYAIGTSVGMADPQCAATFRLLAPRLLGMDGRGSRLCIFMRDRPLHAAARSWISVPTFSHSANLMSAARGK